MNENMFYLEMMSVYCVGSNISCCGKGQPPFANQAGQGNGFAQHRQLYGTREVCISSG